MVQLLPCLQDMQADHWSMIVFWNEAKGQAARRGPDVGLDFTEPPNGDDVDYPGYEDPHGDMLVDDEDMPPPQSRILAMTR